MTENELAQRFEQERPHLRAVAYRMLGSLSGADDVVQDAWLRLRRSDASRIENLGGWLTTVVARLCLDELRTRKARREDNMGFRMPEPVISAAAGPDPEQVALVADSLGLALMVVLDTLTPPERLAFVLHDVFGIPFDQIAPIVSRTPEATRQLASRARRRVHRAAPVSPTLDRERQRKVVDAFVVAARAGDLKALIATLDPDVIVRNDFGRERAAGLTEVRGAEEAASTALLFRRHAAGGRPALINGNAGLVVFAGARPFAVLAFEFTDERIAEIYVLADPVRLAQLDLTVLDA